MKITEVVKTAIGKLVADYENPHKLSLALKVSNTTVEGWLKGKTKSISDATWIKLLPLLRKHLPSDDQALTWESEIGRDSITPKSIFKLLKEDKYFEDVLKIWIDSNPLEKQQLRDIIETWQLLSRNGQDNLLSDARSIWGNENPQHWK